MPARRTVSTRLLTTVTLVGLTSFGLSCTDDVAVADAGETCGTGLLPGSLVITEVVANAPGVDEGQEWFEIHNAGSETVDLQGLKLVYEKLDGSGHKEHVIARSLEVPAGGYIVVGGILDELAEGTAHIDYGYAGDLGDLGNAGGYLAIECDDIIDAVYYQDATDTASRSFDGSQAPDALANDNLESWCDAKTEFVAGFAATPKAPNDPCAGAASCLDNGMAVDIVHPQLGEIVISEHLPNPTGEDTDKEWFELRNIGAAPYHLNGLQLGTKLDEDAKDEITGLDCITLAPGEIVIVAQSFDPTINGDLPTESIVWATSEITQTLDGTLWVGVAGEHLDEIDWASPAEGVAFQLSPSFQDPVANDDRAYWCDADQPYGSNGDLGTPGSENTACPNPPPPDGQCYENGELRDIVPLDPGDIDIVEYHANPDVVDDGDGEWFEIRVSGTGDLNGLQIGKAGAWQDTVDPGDVPAFASDACFTVSPGQYVVFAHSDDPLVNGGIPQVDVLFDMALNNSNSDLILGYGSDPSMPDAQVSWASVTAGKSTAKDAFAIWCDGQAPYGDGDFGSPGTANPACEGAPTDGCIDPDTNLMRMINPPAMGEFEITEIMSDPMGAPDATGEWFEIHALAPFDLNGLQLGKGGVVSHTVSAASCIEITADSYVVFARSDVDAENCTLPNIDYVYDAPALNNSSGNLQVGYADVILSEHSWPSSTPGAAHSYDEMAMSWCPAVDPFGCGDLGTPGAANPACGGGNNMGGMCFDTGLNMMRPIVTPMPGDLIINEFMANPNAVTDTAGEWFELLAIAPCDLNGLELGQAFVNGPSHVINSANCISLGADETALLARNADPMVNGGLPQVDYVYAGFGLTNSNGALHVADQGVLIDEATWVSSGTGRSTGLDPNDGMTWCVIPADPMYQFGGGDYGTPDAGNPACP